MRKNGVIQPARHETLNAVQVGSHVMGPYDVNGVDAFAAAAEFTSGTGSGLVTLQRAYQRPNTEDVDIQWHSVGSTLSANGEIQSGKQVSMLARVVVLVHSGTIQAHFAANARNI